MTTPFALPRRCRLYTMPAASKSLVTTRSNCPLCSSNSRREIDLLIHARHFSHPDQSEPILVAETDPDVSVDLAVVEHNETYADTYVELKELLSKLPSDSTAEFSLSDLIIHATQHTLVSEIVNDPLHSEGALLFYGDRAYKKIDPIDFMDWVLIQAAEMLSKGQLQITGQFIVNIINTRWRMTGNTGDDGFLGVLMDKHAQSMEGDDPLAAGYREHQEKLRRARAETKQEPADEHDSEPAETTPV